MIAFTDLLLTVSNVGFFLAMLPAIRDSLRGRTSVTMWTSLPTAIFLVNIAFATFLLGQVFAATTIMAVATCWAFLAGRRWVEGDHDEEVL